MILRINNFIDVDRVLTIKSHSRGRGLTFKAILVNQTIVTVNSSCSDVRIIRGYDFTVSSILKRDNIVIPFCVSEFFSKFNSNPLWDSEIKNVTICQRNRHSVESK